MCVTERDNYTEGERYGKRVTLKERNRDEEEGQRGRQRKRMIQKERNGE